jgi:hypothetical protein
MRKPHRRDGAPAHQDIKSEPTRDAGQGRRQGSCEPTREEVVREGLLLQIPQEPDYYYRSLKNRNARAPDPQQDRRSDNSESRNEHRGGHRPILDEEEVRALILNKPDRPDDDSNKRCD